MLSKKEIERLRAIDPANLVDVAESFRCHQRGTRSFALE